VAVGGLARNKAGNPNRKGIAMRHWWLGMIVVALALQVDGALAAKKRQEGPKADPWQVSYELALKQAKESNRPVLACFLGSDWCPYCVRLLKESIWTNEFRIWAAEKAVVLILDFPKNTPQLPARGCICFTFGRGRRCATVSERSGETV
jgi:hypothetical protein